MSEFGSGVEQGNNMLAQMEGRNARIKATYNARVDSFNNQLAVSEGTDKNTIQSGQDERNAQKGTEKLAGESSQFVQAGRRFSNSADVLQQVYKGSVGDFIKGGGRVGDELSPSRVISSVKSAGQASVDAVKQFAKSGGRNLTRVPGPQQVKPVNPGDPVQVEPPAATEKAVATSAVESGAEDSVSVDRAALTAGSKVAGGVAEAVGTAGVALGIVQGGVSLATDLTGGFDKLANNEDKASNVLSVASGVADTIGLVFPPAAIFGGLFGIASAITGTIGSLEEAKAKVDTGSQALKTAQNSKPPAEQQGPGAVATLSSLGQVASVGSSVGAKISGTSAF
tara:strand:- start:1828 stop:2844 length:1017 start_codon:yes stop_codon:yes gene_type:complete